MKLKLHSQLQSRNWILHWSASNHGKNYGFFLFSLSLCTFLSGPGWSPCAGCVLNISQWWLIVWAAARSCVESDFTDRYCSCLSLTKELLPPFLYLALSLSFSLSVFFFWFFCCQSFLSLLDSCLSFKFICIMQLMDIPVRVLRCVSSACLCAGHQNCLSGAQHSRSGGWDPNAEGKRLTEHWGQRGGDQTDGGLQEPL